MLFRSLRRHGMKARLLLSIVLLTLTSNVIGKDACLRYNQEINSLRGILQIKVYFGPPNYGENPDTDSRETQGVLFLDKAICTAKEEGSEESTQVNQIEVTLVSSLKVRLFRFAGKKVIVSGKLFEAHTGHHHTPLLLSLSSITK